MLPPLVSQPPPLQVIIAQSLKISQPLSESFTVGRGIIRESIDGSPLDHSRRKGVQNGVAEVKWRGLGTRQAKNKNLRTFFLIHKNRKPNVKKGKNRKPQWIPEPIFKVTKTAEPKYPVPKKAVNNVAAF